MNRLYVYICILLMALITYVIRILPLVLFRRPITNAFIRSFLYYAPYVTLSVLAFPAVLYCTESLLISGLAFLCAVVMTLIFGNFVLTTLVSCLLVFVLKLFV